MDVQRDAQLDLVDVPIQIAKRKVGEGYPPLHNQSRSLYAAQS